MIKLRTDFDHDPLHCWIVFFLCHFFFFLRFVSLKISYTPVRRKLFFLRDNVTLWTGLKSKTQSTIPYCGKWVLENGLTKNLSFTKLS